MFAISSNSNPTLRHLSLRIPFEEQQQQQQQKQQQQQQQQQHGHVVSFPNSPVDRNANP